MKYRLHVSPEWFILRGLSKRRRRRDNSFTSFVIQRWTGKKDCLHNLIFLYLGLRSDRARATLGRWSGIYLRLFSETRFSRWSHEVSLSDDTALAISSSVHDRNIRVWHGALVIMRATNPEPPELRINERSRYAMRVCPVYRHRSVRGTIWCPWKSMAISVCMYTRHYRRT